MPETLEFTTAVGCKINCMKYCPQEIITKNYTGEKHLTFENFKKFIETVPSDVIIIFAGVSEPFLNQEITDMILYAYNKGHKISVFSTLQGLQLEDAKKLCTVKFESFILHLPDAKRIANIQITENYKETLLHILTNIPNLKYMSMNDNFISDRNEQYFRGLLKPKTKCRVTCAQYKQPNYIVMPNGNVYFCCQTKGLKQEIGNLFKQSYDKLVKLHPATSYHLSEYPESICHYCTWSEPCWKSVIRNFINKLISILDKT